jgi:WD40 repeat protein
MRLQAVLRIVAVGIAVACAGGVAAQEKLPVEKVLQLGHSNMVLSVAFSPDGKTALSGSWDQTARLWDLATGCEIRRLEGHSSVVNSVAFSPDGKTALTGSYDNTVRLWDLATGREIRRLEGHSGAVNSVAFSPDGKTALSGGGDVLQAELKLWDLATGREIRKFEGHSREVSREVTSVAFSPDGKTALSGSNDNSVRLWDLATGREIRKLEARSIGVNSVAFSPDGKTALSGSNDKTARLWDLATGREINMFEGHSREVKSVAFSPDGKTALTGSYDSTARLWDLATGREIRKFEGHSGYVTSVAFSPDGKTALSGSWDQTARLWDLATGREIKKFAGHSVGVWSVAFSPDGNTALSGSSNDNTVRLWDLATGREIRKFEGHSDAVLSVAFSPDGNTALTASNDGTMRLWNLQSGEELAALIASRDGEYMAFTPRGFFAASQRDTDMLAIARGMEVTTIGQVYQSLFNPDLVRMTLSGDPGDRAGVEEAAEHMNLDKVLDSGPAPEVAILSPGEDSKSASDVVTVAARATDKGKGVGRIEWRVNGITAATATGPSGKGPVYEMSRELALDPGRNIVEVIAYNGCVEQGCNLLASLPGRTTVEYTAPASSTKGKLHVLAIGIDNYIDKGYAPPGFGKQTFGKLTLAVADAKAFADEMTKAGAEMYSEVRIWPAHDAGATAAGLDAIFKKLAAEAGPRDTFVLFAAAHGYSDERGRFYLIPQDYQGGPDSFEKRAISQEKLQEWMANIRARKAVILLDSCNSGEAVNGYLRSRTEDGASEAAVGRLHEATGRPVLTASNGGATETGLFGHGIFTAALLQALHRAGGNEGLIRVSDLAGYIEDTVPKLTAELEKQKELDKQQEKKRAAVVIRGGGTGAQAAHFGTTGGDFALVKRLP